MIPVLSVRGKTIPEAWENSLIILHKHGCDIKTEYDKPEDPPSKDCTMMIEVTNPLDEPRVHRCFPGLPQNLVNYVNEVLHGSKDNEIVSFLESKNTGRLYYTYHSRLFRYNPARFVPKDQIHEMCKILARVPYSRRAQAITWVPEYDLYSSDPPCLQRIWCRMTQVNKEGSPKWELDMNVLMRSNDAYQAAFMNMYAFVHLQMFIANEIGRMRNEPVRVGRYCHQADSYHIYGKDLNKFQGLLKRIEDTELKYRTWSTEQFSKYVK